MLAETKKRRADISRWRDEVENCGAAVWEMVEKKWSEIVSISLNMQRNPRYKIIIAFIVLNCNVSRLISASSQAETNRKHIHFNVLNFTQSIEVSFDWLANNERKKDTRKSRNK